MAVVALIWRCPYSTPAAASLLLQTVLRAVILNSVLNLQSNTDCK